MSVRTKYSTKGKIAGYLSDFTYNKKRHRKFFKSADKAQEYERKKRFCLENSMPFEDEAGKPIKQNITIREMFDLVLENQWKGLPNYDNGFSHAKMFEKAFGHSTPAKDITTKMLYDFKKDCEDSGNAPATIKLKLASLSAAFNFCIDNEYLDERPKFPKVKVSNGRVGYFSRQDEIDILNFLEESGENYFYDFFCWQMDTGCRPSESRAIHRKQIINDDPVLGHVVELYETKNDEPRVVPLTRRALASFKNHEDKEHPWQYWTKERIRTVWDKVRAALGKTGDRQFVFYLTRHTCGSRIVQATGSIYLVKDMLGHKTLEQSMRYGKLAPHNLRQALCALDRGLESGDRKVTHMSSFGDIDTNEKKGGKIASCLIKKT